MVSFFRTAILYILIIAVMRLMGKRQVGQLQPYELVVTIMISELAAIPMQNTGIPLLSGIIPILSLVALQITISLILQKSNRIRRIISGTPVVMIKEGIIIEENLNKEVFNLSDLLEAVRLEGYTDLSEIKTAMLETNGKLSVYGYDTVHEPLNLILDGKYMDENIISSGKTKEDVISKAKEQGAKNVSRVLLCRYYKDENNEGEKWYIQLKT